MEKVMDFIIKAKNRSYFGIVFHSLIIDLEAYVLLD